MMDRRWAGIVLLVAAVAAAIVLGSLRTKQVPGSASAAPAPDPPSVGNCLGEFGGSNYPDQAPVVPCDRPHFAEVVAVMPDALPEVASAGSYDDPDSPINACPRETNRYLGIADDAYISDLVWHQTAQVTGTLIQPTELDRMLGSGWVACAAAVGGADLSLQPYDGTLRNAATTGHLPPMLATCPLSTEQLSLNQHCDHPHPMESFGTITVAKKIDDLAAVTASCADLVKARTGLADPAAGGRMTVAVLQDKSTDNYVIEAPGSGAEPTTVTLTQMATYYCLVRTTGTHELTGPLLGLHGGPIPLK